MSLVKTRVSMPKMGCGTVLAVPIMVTLGLLSCEQQNPAFKENVSAGPQSGDLRKTQTKEIKADGSLDPETRNAPTPSDGEANQSGAESAKKTEKEAGEDLATMKEENNDTARASSTVPKSASTGTSTSAEGPGTEGGVGGESGLDVNWRTVEVTQGGPGKVDILWVVDTSGSMSEEQAYLATNFNVMINALATAGQDFQTAITTTDVCQDSIPSDLSQRVCPVNYGGSSKTHLRGSFVGDQGRKVLKKGDADLVQKFNKYTLQGVDGSGFEHGLEAAHMAIQKVISGQNENLIRSDAFLAVIVVSDEEDDGIGLGLVDSYNGHNFVGEGLTTFKWSDDDMISYLQTVKGKGNFSISAITGTRKPDGTMCSAPHTHPLEEGTQYIKAAAKSGGLLQSICDTNWNQSLATLGADLNAQITQVTLPTTPDPATIKVKVNGAASSDWTYNSANNGVKFGVGHIPVEGAKISITYAEKM